MEVFYSAKKRKASGILWLEIVGKGKLEEDQLEQGMGLV